MELSGTRLKNQESLVEHRIVCEHSQILIWPVFLLVKQGLENTCFCRRVRKCGELLLFTCTLLFSRGRLYDTNRFCPSVCIGTVLNPSGLREDNAVQSVPPPTEQAEELLLRVTWRKPACMGCLREECLCCWMLVFASSVLVLRTACCNKIFLL